MPRIPPSLLRTLSQKPPMPSPAFRAATMKPNATMLPSRIMTSLIFSSALPTSSFKFNNQRVMPNNPTSGFGRSLLPSSVVQQSRTRTFGAEYQPSQRKRKRRHGFLARLKSISGRKILKRRLKKGRKYLSH